MEIEQIKELIRDVPDFPEPGIVFKDITPVLAHPDAFSTLIDLIVVHFGRGTVDKVVGIEARGFIVAAPVAYHFNAGFAPIRKVGKLPWETIEEEYDLEYGTATLAIHRDAVAAGERVLIVDDVLATGGTAKAAASLVEQCGGTIRGIACLIELDFLEGRKKLTDHELHTFIHSSAGSPPGGMTSWPTLPGRRRCGRDGPRRTGRGPGPAARARAWPAAPRDPPASPAA